MFGEDPSAKFPQKQSSLLTSDVTGQRNHIEEQLGYNSMDVSDITGKVARQDRPIAGAASRPDGGNGAPWANGGIYDGQNELDRKKQNVHPAMAAAGGRTTMESRGNMSDNMNFVMGAPEDNVRAQPPMEPIREQPQFEAPPQNAQPDYPPEQ